MVPMSMEEAKKLEAEYELKKRENAKKILEFLEENKGTSYSREELKEQFGGNLIEFNASISKYHFPVKRVYTGKTTQYGIEKETENE